MIGEDAISPLTIPPGDLYPLLQLPLPTIHTRTRLSHRAACPIPRLASPRAPPKLIRCLDSRASLEAVSGRHRARVRSSRQSSSAPSGLAQQSLGCGACARKAGVREVFIPALPACAYGEPTVINRAQVGTVDQNCIASTSFEKLLPPKSRQKCGKHDYRKQDQKHTP